MNRKKYLKHQREIKNSDSKVKFRTILNVAPKQVKNNSYSQEAHIFGEAIKAILEEFQGRMRGLPLVGLSFLTTTWKKKMAWLLGKRKCF